MAFTKQNNPAANKKAAGSSKPVTTEIQQETPVQETPTDLTKEVDLTPAPELTPDPETELVDGTPDLTKSVIEEPEPRVFPEILTEINDVDEARELLRRNYNLAVDDVVFVTSDCNVFKSANDANAHTKRTTLKTFIIKWL